MAKFYATMYSEYPIYEPAEGGYYYAGKTAEDLEDNEYETIEDALCDITKWVEELNEDPYENEWILTERDAKSAQENINYLIKELGPEEGRTLIAYRPSKYIGEGAQIYIEIPAAYKKDECGWRPYQ